MNREFIIYEETAEINKDDIKKLEQLFNLVGCPWCKNMPSIAQNCGRWYVACCNIDCKVMPCTSEFSLPSDAINSWNEAK